MYVFIVLIFKNGSLKQKYNIIYDVLITKKGIVNFINHFSSEKMKPYRVTRLITLNDYLDKYKERHYSISKFYGDLTPESYKENIEKMKSIIEKENKEKKLVIKTKDQKELYESFFTFDLTQDLKTLDEKIIKEYTKNTFYGDLNKWLMNTNFNSYEVVAYFTARLMYSLNKYANKEGTYFDSDKKDLHRGMKLSYSNLLPYERAKGKIILLSGFTSTSEKAEVAEFFSQRKKAQNLYKKIKKFSVILKIKNYYKKNWIANGVKIETISYIKSEREILYQPFSFYYVRDVQIDLNNYKADIYLETIGKQEILEEKIKIGKEIEYNEKEKIMQVIN